VQEVDVSIIRFTLHPGDAVAIRAEGHEGYTFFAFPENKNPSIKVNETNQLGTEKIFFLTHEKLIDLEETGVSLALGDATELPKMLNEKLDELRKKS
jgi:hypothetical protein